MKPLFTPATIKHKEFFWIHYCEAMKAHIETLWGWDETWQQQDFEQRWQDCENLLIEYNGQKLGYLQIQHQAENTYLMMLILLPQFRGQNIGKEALDHSAQLDPTKAIQLRVFRVNKAALKFYLNNGFKVEAEEECFYLLKSN